MTRLFGHLASRFGHSSEELATEALCYILRSSDEMLVAFIDHVNEVVDGGLGTNMRLVTEKSTDDGGRPDLIGWDRQTSNRLFVESKFGAALTGNQPTGYLQALEKDEGSVLLFLVPERRKQNVWREVIQRSKKDRKFSGEPRDFRAQVDGTPVGITTWSNVLEVLNSAVSTSDPARIEEDIRQLRGLCRQEGADSFRPFKEGEFSPSMAQRIIDINTLVVDLGNAVDDTLEAWVGSKKPSFAKHKYRFKRRLYGHNVEVGVRYGWWRNKEVSPFWVRLFIDDVATQHAVFDSLNLDVPLFEGGKYSPEDVLIPLSVPYGQSRDETIDSLLSQLDNISEQLASVLSSD